MDAARRVTAGDIVWTAPHRFEIPPLVNYGYAKHAMHLVQITAAPDLKAGAPLVLAAKASWLVCADVCIPESADTAIAPAGRRRAAAPSIPAAAPVVRGRPRRAAERGARRRPAP